MTRWLHNLIGPFLLSIFGAVSVNAAEIRVPIDAPTVTAALAGASNGDTIRITDDAIYSGDLYINKRVFIVADANRTPTIQATSQHAVAIDDGMIGGRLGSSAGGRIKIDANGKYYGIRLLNDAAGTAEIQNVHVMNATEGIGSFGGAGGTAILDDALITNSANYALRLARNGENVTMTDSRIDAGPYAAVYLDSGWGSINLTRTNIGGPRQSIYLAGNAPGQAWSIAITECCFLTTSAGYECIRVGGFSGESAVGASISLVDSAIHADRFGVAAWENTDSASISSIRSDLVCADLGASGFTSGIRLLDGSSGRTCNVIDSNIVATHALYHDSAAPADSLSSNYNNLYASAAKYSNWPPGADDLSPSLLPSYGNTAACDFRYSSPILKTASSTNGRIGTDQDFAQGDPPGGGGGGVDPPPGGGGGPVLGEFTRDWHADFRDYADYIGTYYAANPDEGILAWGEAYLQRQFLNLYESYGETFWLDTMVENTDLMIANMSDVPRFSPYSAQYVDGYASWGQNRYVQYAPNYTEWLSSHGNIIQNVVKFAEIVYGDSALHAAYLPKAQQYVSAIETEIIELWRANWAPDPGWAAGDMSRFGSDAGYHVYEFSGWINQPFNMHL